jgi:serine/threonine protein kinase
MLQIIDAVAFIHSPGLGLVHRDLTAHNILVAKPIQVASAHTTSTDDARALAPGLASEPNPLVLCHLQCRHSTLKPPSPPEVCRNGRRAFTPASGVYGLGYVLWQLCYYNTSIDRFVLLDFPPPPPFDAILKRCVEDDLGRRRRLGELRVMLLDLDVDAMYIISCCVWFFECSILYYSLD